MTKPPVLLGCGILQKEIEHLIQKNAWSLSTDFLAASLHVNFEKLASELQQGFIRHQDEEVIVFYGHCHPKMEHIVAANCCHRTQAQNCVEMLLGSELFSEHLTQGAFFLLEDWVLNWDNVIIETFGNKPDITREIFQLSHRYFLGLCTPCSGDYAEAAEKISVAMGLPLRWLQVDLVQLESVLKRAIQHNK